MNGMTTEEYFRLQSQFITKEQVLEQAPSITQKAWNFTKALARFVKNKAEFVTQEEYEKRLKICDLCPFRDGSKCQNKGCGCNLLVKLQWASESCPIGNFDAVTDETDKT